MSIHSNIYYDIACSDKNSKIQSNMLHSLKTKEIKENLIKYSNMDGFPRYVSLRRNAYFILITQKSDIM